VQMNFPFPLLTNQVTSCVGVCARMCRSTSVRTQNDNTTQILAIQYTGTQFATPFDRSAYTHLQVRLLVHAYTVTYLTRV
jgi:hypothetical protein